MSTKSATKTTFGPNTLDTRVRERFLDSGVLEPKALEKHLSELPDVAAQCEPVGLAQPAIGDDEDDEDDDDLDDEEGDDE
jgi:hypothetical protein